MCHSRTRRLSSPRRLDEHLAVGRDHVTEVGVGEGGIRLLPELVERGVELEPPGPVGQVEEHRLAVAPAGRDPARNRQARP